MNPTSKWLFTTSFFIVSLCSSNSFAHELVLTVDNIQNTKGVLMVALHNTETAYKANTGTFAGKKVAVTNKTMTLSFSNLPAGDYAVKLFQDENENGLLDTNAIGIPKEGYGFSNNGGAMGQPSFSAAKFSVDADTQITIHLR